MASILKQAGQLYQGCFTQGKTVEEATERAAEAIEVRMAGLEADGEPVPEEHEPPRLVTVTVAA